MNLPRTLDFSTCPICPADYGCSKLNVHMEVEMNDETAPLRLCQLEGQLSIAGGPNTVSSPNPKSTVP
jgi:hypothetical protein